MATGLLGQYVYVNPTIDLIIVRLGRSEGNIKDWPDLFKQISAYYEQP